MILRWEEQAPEAEPRKLREATAGLPFLDAIHLVSELVGGLRLWLEPSCRAGIARHLESGWTEMGGLLIGRAFVPEADCPANWGPLVAVEDYLASEEFQTSAVSLAMGTEVWDRARQALEGGRRMVVGWYHSHPNLGAFFSSTDRRTQRAFFGQAFNIGLVVDPVRGEEAWFAGPDAVALAPGAVLTRPGPVSRFRATD